jgi:hypothetical protein
MYGRSAACLLLVLFVLTLSLMGQSDRQVRSPEALPDPHIWIPQNPEAPAPPFHNSLRRPVLSVDSPALPQISGAAGTIFSGTVTRIDHRAATSGAPVETVSITFHVENAIRGVMPGQDLTISQWIGLWSAGQRYSVGERVLLFLYPRSKLGLTSCVGGQIGRFVVDTRGRVLLSSRHLSAFRADPVLGGRSRVPLRDFALAVRRAGGEE